MNMIFINKLITIFPILFYPLINILALFILGFGLTVLVLPKSLKPFWLWLSPWTTIISAIFCFVVMSLFGLSIRQVILPYIVFFIGIDLYLLLKIKPRLNLNIKRDLTLIIIIGLTLVINLSPIIKNEKILTTISFGNNDVIAYTSASDYLKFHSIGESFRIDPDEATGTLLRNGYRWGTPMINSFFLTILNLQGYQYTYVSQVVLFSLFLPLLYILFRILYGKSNLIGLIMVSIFAGFNANLLYILYHNFFGQVLFWGIETLIFIFIYSYFYSEKIKSSLINVYDLILGILIGVLYFSYHEPAVIMFAPLGIFLLTIFFKKKELLAYYLQALVKIILITLTIALTSIINATVTGIQTAFMVNSNQPIGWQLFRSKVPFANPFEAMGFWSIHNFEPVQTILAIALSVMVILIIIKGVLKSKYKILTISYLLIFSLFFYWTGINQHNFFVYNRALTYTLPFIVVIFSIGLTSLYEKQRYFWSIIIVILICFELWSVVNLNKRFIREHLSIGRSLPEILNIKIKVNEPIYTENHIVEATSLWKQIWTNYFLYSKGVFVIPTIFNNNEFENKVPNNGLVLISKINSKLCSLKIIFKNIILNNDYFILGHICNSDDCLMKSKYKLDEIKIGNNEYEDSLLINGWNIGEGETRWANEKESTLRLVTKDIYPTNLTIEALSLGKPQEMTVYLDDQLLGEISVNTEWKIYNLPINYLLNPGVHRIKFAYSHGYRPMDVIPGNVDSRILYVNFKEIKLE